MSRRTFTTEKVVVAAGWDRPLQRLHLTVYDKEKEARLEELQREINEGDVLPEENEEFDRLEREYILYDCIDTGDFSSLTRFADIGLLAEIIARYTEKVPDNFWAHIGEDINTDAGNVTKDYGQI